MHALTSTRRDVLLASAGFLLAASTASWATARTDDPVAIVTAIYRQVASGAGDGGGRFLLENAGRRRQAFSRALEGAWKKAQAAARKTGEAALDFDPITNSQDPGVSSFKVVAEAVTADTARIAVTLAGAGYGKTDTADNVVSYHFVREGGGWKIDDISGSVDGQGWSLRKLLAPGR